MTAATKKLWTALKKADHKKVEAAAPTADLVAPNRSGLTPLGYAALHGDVSSVRMLLDAGADPDGRMDYGVVPLVLSARHPETCAVLAGHADVNASTDAGTTALHRAAFWNQLASVEALLGRGADVHARDRHGRDALSFAAERATVDIVGLLLDAGAEINGVGRAPRDSLFRHEFYTIARPEVTALTLASTPGRAKVRGLLQERGADLDAVGLEQISPVMVAASRGLESLVEDLAAAGADLSRTAAARGGLGGVTPLFCAIDAGEDALALRLLELGAPAQNAEGRRSALGAAVDRDAPELVRALVGAGADPDVPPREGDYNALERAVSRGSAQAAEALVSVGAAPGKAREMAEETLDARPDLPIADILAVLPV